MADQQDQGQDEGQILSWPELYRLRQTIDFFDNFWKKQKRWEPRERVPIFERLPIPFWDPPRPDPAYRNPQVTQDDASGRNVPFHHSPRTDSSSDSPMVDQMRRFFEGLNMGYTMVKVLGAGSQGVAVLFDFNGEKIVMKWSTELRAMVTELWANRKMVGARHIVQRKWRPGILEMGLDRDGERINDILVLAHLSYYKEELNDIVGPRVPLMGLLRKISQQRPYLKDSELWNVFLCLFRACVGLAYPDRWAPQGYVPGQGDAPDQEEFVPVDATGRALPTDLGIINFDMNDRNVMIGDFSNTNPPEHPHNPVPVVKVGDLGVVSRFLPEHRNDFTACVMGRIRGNMWCNSPEQFTDTWKNVDSMESLAADDVAGKFDWWSNLWQVGRLMAIMDPVKAMIWTYAGHLVGPDYDRYDPLLRSTVAWCIAHRPMDRPQILELETLLMAAVAVDRSATEGPDRTTIASLLGSVPPAMTQTPSGLVIPAAGPAGPAGP
ncbi:serine threonine protein kinase [Diaporthe amygdali]|uniref:serine threonine protein kinase n=1 Tax=Phomopsis amygdali TaxID=1214568 RepID=UPI0022FEF5C9|nr:serine threonine protein kinase [Diaporthe amygdali]KAJ0116909.1 serine threonine protein kinase [Diaporthe amygdali]